MTYCLYFGKLATKCQVRYRRSNVTNQPNRQNCLHHQIISDDPSFFGQQKHVQLQMKAASLQISHMIEHISVGVTLFAIQ